MNGLNIEKLNKEAMKLLIFLIKDYNDVSTVKVIKDGLTWLVKSRNKIREILCITRMQLKQAEETLISMNLLKIDVFEYKNIPISHYNLCQYRDDHREIYNKEAEVDNTLVSLDKKEICREALVNGLTLKLLKYIPNGTFFREVYPVISMACFDDRTLILPCKNNLRVQFEEKYLNYILSIVTMRVKIIVQ